MTEYVKHTEPSLFLHPHMQIKTLQCQDKKKKSYFFLYYRPVQVKEIRFLHHKSPPSGSSECFIMLMKQDELCIKVGKP